MKTLPFFSFSLFKSSLVLLLLLCTPHYVSAAKDRNVTVDDTDSSIVYSGDWGVSAKTDLNYGGAHHLSANGAATATFKFTGTAIYFMSPKWPYDVNTAVSLDNGPKQTIDLVDHSKPTTSGGSETAGSSVVWSQTNLQNTSHTLVVSMANNYVIVDGFIFTESVADDTPTSSSSSASSSTSKTSTGSAAASATSSGASSSNAQGNTSSSKNTLGIALGTVFGVLGALALVAAFLLWRRRQHHEPVAPPANSTWEKNAFAPQFAGNGDGPGSPPGAVPPSLAGSGYSQYQSVGAGQGHSSYPTAPQPTYGSTSTAAPQPTYGTASPGSNYPSAAAAGAAGLGAGAAAAAGLGRSASHQSNHPYGYAGTPPPPQQQQQPYGHGSYAPQQHYQQQPYDPYANTSYGAPQQAAYPSPWENNAANSSQSSLRPQNLNTDVRQSHGLSQESTQLAYAASGTADLPPPAAGDSQQPRYLSSQEEKAALYRKHAAEDAGGSSSAPSGPPGYYN